MRFSHLRIPGALVLLLASAETCTTPRAQSAMIQEMSDAAAAIDGLRNDVAQLQTDLDSLRTVVAKQDTLLNRLSAGLPR
jgi:hypothetical protein